MAREFCDICFPDIHEKASLSSSFRSCFPKNIDFEVFTSTNAEFDADHENDLGFFG